MRCSQPSPWRSPLRDQPRPQTLLPRRPGKQSLCQRAEIKPSPASHDRQLASPGNVLSAARACRLYSPAVNGTSGVVTSIR